MNAPSKKGRGAADAGSAPLLSIDGARATLRLNRPAEHNRIDPQDLGVMHAQLESIGSQDALRVLVITGTGEKTFCSGYTLDALTDMRTESSLDPAADKAAGDSTREPTLDEVIDRVERLRIPTICALNGSVYGGGTDLALACDFRIGVTGSKMLMPATRIGLHYYANGMRRYVERLGVGTAKHLFLIGEAADAQEMLRFGFLTELVAPLDLPGRVDALAARIAANPPTVVRNMKRHLNSLAGGRFDAEAITRDHEASLRSQDLREGLAAMREKRDPKFTGR